MAEENVTRTLTAILYADVAGYSRLTGEDEVDERLRDALEHIDRERLVAAPARFLEAVNPDPRRQ